MYKLLKNIDGSVSNCIKRIIDGSIIPNDITNTDYQAYLKWVEEGNTPLPADK